MRPQHGLKLPAVHGRVASELNGRASRRLLDARQGAVCIQAPPMALSIASILEIAMFTHILIATDGSELADKAVTQGLALAKALNAKATAVTATEAWDALSMAAAAEANRPSPVASYEKHMAAVASRILQSVTEAAKKLDVPCATVHAKDHHPAEGIIETAQAQGCDLIVMASHGRHGIAKLLLGSVASRVVVLSPVPVLVCR
jgi:nucleotide-binding universal stress UspA family protein